MPRLAFDQTSHTFTLGGVVVPHVTGILKLDPTSGIARMDFLSDGRAAEKGTRIHEAIARFNRTGAFGKVRPDEIGYLLQYARWYTHARPVLTGIEMRVYNKALGYAGIVDLVGTMRGPKPGPFVMDLKSGVKLKWHGRQLAAYDMALPRVPPPLRRRRLGLYLKAGRLRVVEYTDPSDYTAFVQLLDQWRTR